MKYCYQGIETGLVISYAYHLMRQLHLLKDTTPSSTKAQLDYISINKWINSAMNCEAYFSFEGLILANRIILVKIHLSCHKNIKKKKKKVRTYDWLVLTHFAFFVFNGILTFMGYLMLNPSL